MGVIRHRYESHLRSLSWADRILFHLNYLSKLYLIAFRLIREKVQMLSLRNFKSILLRGHASCPSLPNPKILIRASLPCGCWSELSRHHGKTWMNKNNLSCRPWLVSTTFPSPLPIGVILMFEEMVRNLTVNEQTMSSQKIILQKCNQLLVQVCPMFTDFLMMADVRTDIS